MPVISYLTWEGEILSETRSGVESDYLPDPLGSTAALLNSSQVKTDTFSWWPYGEQRSHSGTSLTPFGFNGTWGNYGGLNGIYIGSRILSPQSSSWKTVDKFWPYEMPYSYVSNNPLTFSDVSGNDKYGKIEGCKNSGDWNNPACARVQELALFYLRKHFSESEAELLSKVMACIAAGESGCMANDGKSHKKGGKDKKDRGLFSIDRRQWSIWGGGTSFDDCAFNADKNTQTAVNMIVYLLKHGSGTIAHRLCAFGVLYCHNLTDAGDEAQNPTAMCCLKDKGLLGIYSSSPPQPR